MDQRAKGKCKYCGKEYTRTYIMRHLAACKARLKRREEETGTRVCGYFDLLISGKYDRDMWLAVAVKETATLEDVDSFLRDIWLECCGHLSAFRIGEDRYESHPDQEFFWGVPAKSMQCKLKKILEKGMSFSYEYDFGSTTDLVIQVANYWKGNDRGEKLTLLSRNNPENYMCGKCKKRPAVYIDPQCPYEENPFYCEKCADKWLEGCEYLLKVCNSPRMGVCGYDGSEIYPDQFVADPELEEK